MRAPLSCLAGLVLAILIGSGPLHAADRAGRPVTAVLREVQARGLVLIYNDTLVPDTLRVLEEPVATSDLAMVREILAPHGLRLRGVGGSAWAIVAAPGGVARPGPAAGSGQSASSGMRGTLDEVVVSTSQYRLAQSEPGPRTFMTHDELRQLPKLGDEALRAVHRLPGAASNGVSGLAHIRGGEENETQLVLDGMTLEEPFHLKRFFSPISILDAEIIGDLNVYSGGFPATRGDRMSALTEVSSVTPPAAAGYMLGLSLFHAHGLAAGSSDDGRARWLVSGRRSNVSEVLSLAESNLGEPRYLDAFLKGEYDLSPATTVALRTLLADDQLELNDSDETTFARAGDHSTYLWLTLEHRWSEQLKGRVMASYTGLDNDRTGRVDEPGRRTGDFSDERDTNIAGWRIELEQGGEASLWLGGVEGAWLRSRYDYTSRLETGPDYPFPGNAPTLTTRDFAPAPDGIRLGTFVTHRRRLGEHLTGEAGLRWDRETYTDTGDDDQWSPRLNLLWDYSPSTQLRASLGRFYQTQAINDLQVEDGRDRFSAAQRADHLILSLEHLFSAGLDLRVEAYYKDYENLRIRFENLLDPFVLLPELEPDRIGVAPTSGSARGVELLLRNPRQDALQWWLSYAWSRVTERVDSDTVARSWDQRHTLNGGINWSRGAWDLSLAGTWHSGWPTTTLSLGPVVAGPDGPYPEVIVNPRNDASLDAFRSVDVRASRRFAVGRGELQAFVEITNLLAFRNPCCVSYTITETSGGELRLDRDLDYWPRFVPNLGVQWRF